MTQNPGDSPHRPSVLPKPPTFQDDKMYLVARLGDDIGPYMSDAPEDRMSARLMGWNLVAAHAPQTEAEGLHAGRIVALSFTMLDLLKEIRKDGLPPALKLKYVAAAVAMNRTICDAERSLERQKRAHREEERVVHRLTRPPHDPDIDARIIAMTEAAMQEYQAAVAERRAGEAAAQAGQSPAPSAPADQEAPPRQAAATVTPIETAAQAERTAHAAPGRAAGLDSGAPPDCSPDTAALTVLESAYAAAASRLDQLKARYKGAPPPHSKAAQEIQQQQRVVDTVRLKLAQARQRFAAESTQGSCRAAA